MEYAAGDQAHAEAVRRIKGAFDPNGILAPGRYDGSSSAGERR